MSSFSRIIGILVLAAVAWSCADSSRPNYQFMPNMYESVAYEPYSEVSFLPNQQEALVPPAYTIARGKMPYTIPNTLDGKELARVLESPLDSLDKEANLANGKALFDIYCAVCHGAKGDGQGNLVKREKILGVPSYADAGRNVTVGTSYHTIYYGLNSMGSYAVQLNHKERWQVSEYVMELKKNLTK